MKTRLLYHAPLLLILLIFTALAFYYSLILPLGEAPDETVHFDVVQFIAQAGHPPTTEAERAQAGLRGGFAPLYYTLTALPVSFIDLSPPPELRRLDLRPERLIPHDGLSTHQILHTQDETIPGQGVILAWRVVRWMSIPLGWLTIILAYAIARLVVPKYRAIALGAAIFTAFLPRFAINSSVINEDNLAIPLAALTLWLLLKIFKGDTRLRLFAALGGVLALAALTKYYNLVLLPEVLIFLTLIAWQQRWAMRAILKRWGTAALTFVLIAGPWFGFIIIRFGRIAEQGWLLGLATALGEPQIIGGLQQLQGTAPHQVSAPTFTFSEWFFGLLFRSFWAEFGWMTIFAPTPLYWLLGLLTLCAIGGVLYAFYTRRAALRNTTIFLPWLLLATHIALFFGVVSLRYSLGQTIDTGQGRHLFPALPAIALFFVVGLAAFIQGVSRKKMDSRGYTWFNLGLGGLLLTIAVSFPLTSIVRVYYPFFPITTHQRLTESHPSLPISVTDAFSLVDLAVSTTTSAGDPLPVTLTWQIEREVNQDYLVSLCLQDSQDRPVACQRSHFLNGRYPARAWESGDILADTIHIPIPTCYRLTEESYHLKLELWPLVLDTPEPVVTEQPILTHTFSQPEISIRPTDSLKNQTQTFDLWLDNQRLTQPTSLEMNQGVTAITYATENNNNPFTFTHTDQNQNWYPLPQFNTDLYLPCADGPSPFAQTSHFIVKPTLTNGTYQSSSNALPPITLALRPRRLAPLTATLTFSHTLAPLALQLADQPAHSLLQPSSFSLQPSSFLPTTITWQSRRWMSAPLVISLKLLDKEFNIAGEYVGGLGGRYPNVLWAPTEIVEETYPIPIKPDTPAGLYTLEFSLIHQDKNLPGGYEYLPIFDDGSNLGVNLYPATLRLLDSAHDTPPPNLISAQLGDSINLTGYNLIPHDSSVKLALYWQNTNLIPADYTVFTQLIGPDGQAWAQWDNPPQTGRYPTTAWSENDTVVDRYTLTLREGAPAGDYRLLAGMYNPANGERLPVTINEQPQPDNAIQLTVVSLNP